MYIVAFLDVYYEAIGTDRTYDIPNLLVNDNLVQTRQMDRQMDGYSTICIGHK
jgi:hypothetical protein